jgi:sulfite reductase (NADPH) hemoprotein beta-component
MPGIPPGDVSDTQLDAIAGLADRYSFGEVVVTHTQNLVLPNVKTSDLPQLHAELVALELGKSNVNKLTDVITCPGLDFCDLANARSIPLSLEIQERFDRVDYLNDLGEVSIKISGCINACGHHHVGNIGVLGVDKDGAEWYQVSIGGAQGNNSAIGKIIGPSFSALQMPEVIDRLLQVYVRERTPEERFVDVAQRLGIAPFKEHVYATPIPAGELVGEDHYA